MCDDVVVFWDHGIPTSLMQWEWSCNANTCHNIKRGCTILSPLAVAQLQAWRRIFLDRSVGQRQDPVISSPGHFPYSQILVGLRFVAAHPRKTVSPYRGHVPLGSRPNDSCVGKVVKCLRNATC